MVRTRANILDYFEQLSAEAGRLEDEAKQLEKRIYDIENQEQTEIAKHNEEQASVEEKVRGYNLRILNAISNV